MTKAVCCLILALGAASCAPKAQPVDEAPVAPAAKPANKPAAGPAVETVAPVPEGRPRSGMRLPQDRFEKLPDRNDMTATAPVPGAGGVTTATPPPPDAE